VLVPILYSKLSSIAPGIPIDQASFLAFVLWLVSAAFGGAVTMQSGELILKSSRTATTSTFKKTLTRYAPVVLYGLVVVGFVTWLF